MQHVDVRWHVSMSVFLIQVQTLHLHACAFWNCDNCSAHKVWENTHCTDPLCS